MVEVGYLTKKVVSVFCFPLGFSLLMIFAGLFLLYLKPGSRRRMAFIFLGAVWLLVLSLPITGFLLTRSLEAEAGPYANPADLSQKGVQYIVVLGGSRVIADMTPADRWGCSILRVMEGLRLWKSIPSSLLVLSAGSALGENSDAEAMAVLLNELGVPRESLVLETRAGDTIGEARLFSKLVGTKPVALVTSAQHMPRSMELFRSLGLEPIPCPCWFQATRWPEWYRWFLPDAGALLESHCAMKEYLGRLWLKIRRP